MAKRSSVLRPLLRQLFFTVVAVEAFLGSSERPSHPNISGRYFVQTGVLPPLSPVATTRTTTEQLSQSSNGTTHATIARQTYCDDTVGNIPVVYTNNPKAVDKWLCTNLPYDGCILGFDIEVSKSACNAT